MSGFWRRIRGAIGLGVGWAIGWGLVGGVLGLVNALVFPQFFGVFRSILTNAIGFGMFGFVGGALFSGVLTLAEGRRRFDELRLPRFTAWGAIGGGVLGLAAVAFDSVAVGAPLYFNAGVVALTTALGAGCAAGTLLIARSGDQDRLEGPSDLDELTGG